MSLFTVPCPTFLIDATATSEAKSENKSGAAKSVSMINYFVFVVLLFIDIFACLSSSAAVIHLLLLSLLLLSMFCRCVQVFFQL